MKFRKLLYIFLSVLLSPLALQARCMEALKSCPAIDSTALAYLIVDLANGRVIENYNDKTPLVPASIQKLVTIASLSSKLPVNYRYSTDLYARGKVREGTLQGDLLIVGSGDPSLNTTKWPESADFVRECVEEIKSNGIKCIEGRIVIDNSLFPGPSVPPSWMKGDLSQGYGTGVHAFNFCDNASGNKSVSDPGSVFKNRFSAALLENGISLFDSLRHEEKRCAHLFSHKSPPLDEIMRSCMMRSDNMFAEAFLRKFAVESGKAGTVSNGASLVEEHWRKKGAPMSGIKIVDGSGLSRQNRTTADFMAYVLRKMSKDPYFVSYFPLAGQEGTLSSFLRDTPLDGYVAMKTGSMNGIQCYAGYKLDDDYAPTHVIVIILNKMKGARNIARKEIEKALLCIFTDSGKSGE